MLVMQLVDLFWLIGPDLVGHGHENVPLRVHWMDLAAVARARRPVALPLRPPGAHGPRAAGGRARGARAAGRRPGGGALTP